MTRSDLADIAMTWSALKMMALCPAKVRHVALEPDAGERSLAMRMGSGVAALAFGTPPVHVYTGKVRRGKEWDAYLASVAPNALILNEREYAIAAGMVAALRNDPIAAPYLFGPGVEVEVPMTWDVDGRAYRTRGVDFLKRGHWIGELKQARTCQPGKFERDQLRALYPAQVEVYDEGEAILSKRDRSRHPMKKLIVAVEPCAPFIVTTYFLTPSAIRDAQRKIGLYRSKLATCEASNEWPGYALSEVPFEVEESPFDSVDEDELADDAGEIEDATWPVTDDEAATDAA